MKPSQIGLDVGVCVQANLKRTAEDIERLADLPGKVRLVKGAYDGIAVGSHDPETIELAADLHAEYGTDYEVRMLMGVREDAQREPAAEGLPTYQYVPYGGKWFS